MRTLVRLVVAQVLPRVIQSAIGRWTLTILLLLFGVIGLLAAAGSSGDQAVTALAAGIVFTVLGLGMLIFTLRVRRVHTGARSNVRELIGTGKLLPIPAVPPLPKGVSEEDVAHASEYARA